MPPTQSLPQYGGDCLTDPHLPPLLNVSACTPRDLGKGKDPGEQISCSSTVAIATSSPPRCAKGPQMRSRGQGTQLRAKADLIFQCRCLPRLTQLRVFACKPLFPLNWKQHLERFPLQNITLGLCSQIGHFYWFCLILFTQRMHGAHTDSGRSLRWPNRSKKGWQKCTGFP